MLAKIGLIFLSLSLPISFAMAQDDPVRLPGQGEVKSSMLLSEDLGRLVPGGGLLLSFDADNDSFITPVEIASGIRDAFIKADANEDGRMTPLEQIKWTESLPTRDVSLANPARFDPNLDRAVYNEEFTDIILAFAELYKDAETGLIPVIALRSPEKQRRSQTEIEEEPGKAQPLQVPGTTTREGAARRTPFPR